MIFAIFLTFQVLCRVQSRQDMCSNFPRTVECPSISGLFGTDEVIQLVHKRLSSDHLIASYRLGSAAKVNGVICKLPACINAPCLNGGTCMETIDGYQCTCANGTNGLDCNVDNMDVEPTSNPPNPCDAYPCYSGTCKETAEGYECACPDWTNGTNCEECLITDCDDVLKISGINEDGVYEICLPRNGSFYGPIHVWCVFGSQNKFGWTELQRRVNGNVSFDRPWLDYQKGFGDLNTEYWLGNDIIHQLTTQRTYLARVSMILVGDESTHVHYHSFSIGDESMEYQLNIGRADSGSAGDAMSFLDGIGFSTADHDNDLNATSNCAQLYGGGWFHDCGNARLNDIRGPSTNGNDSGIIGEWIVDDASSFFTSINIRVRPRP